MKRSPVTVGEPFALPFAAVLSPAPSQSESQEVDPELARLNAILAQLSMAHAGPIARTGRFFDLGIPRERPGIQHTVYFSRRPVGDKYTVEQDVKVSGYLSYSYLRSGSIVTGLVFSTDRTKTVVEEYKLVVRGKETPKNFSPNFNLEKMGLLLFVAEDSSTLVIPNDVDSGLLVRAG